MTGKAADTWVKLDQTQLSAVIARHAWFRRGAKQGVCANLAFHDLCGLSFAGGDLSGADMTGALMKGIDARGADFSDAILYGADLRLAQLQQINLSRADLRGCCLRGADLTNAVLELANIREGSLARVSDENRISFEVTPAELVGAAHSSRMRICQAPSWIPSG
jgi:uncharacterized protein YjbI with pentapeptide repeats